MRLLSFNIHGCIGRRGIADPDAILRVIEEADADVVALQEVHDESRTDRSFLRALETRLAYPSVIYGPTMRKDEADYGNVLLSRIPPLSHERIDLSQPGREPRGGIRIRFAFQSRDFEITATHLGLAPRERRAQIERLALRDSTTPKPGTVRILMGDLNEWLPAGRANRMLQQQFGPARIIPTFPARFPLFALDRIHVHPPGVRVTRRALKSKRARSASDHLPLVADLDFGPGLT